MDFKLTTVVRHDPDQVWLMLRDEMTRLAAFWEGVDSIEEVERQSSDGGGLRTTHLWRGSFSLVPRPVRPFITPAMLQWTVRALWDKGRRVSWELESARFKGLYHCWGRAQYEPQRGTGTVVSLSGELAAFPERIPYLPRTLARRFQPPIEALLLSVTRSNVARLAEGLESVLAAKPGSAGSSRAGRRRGGRSEGRERTGE